MVNDPYVWRDPFAMDKAVEGGASVLGLSLYPDHGFSAYHHGQPSEALGTGWGDSPDEAIQRAKEDFAARNP